jgi:hypothetical protein
MASNQTSIPVEIVENLDAFSRLRVAQPHTLFDSKLVMDAQPLFWDDSNISGSGTSSTYNTNQSSVTLAVSNLTAGVHQRQTFQRFPYTPGKTQMIDMTGILGTPATGITREIGYFDDKNGCFFRSSPTAVNVVVRSFVTGSAVDTVVAQANWNLDKMNGSGVSGITVDWSKTQIFVIMFQWLGVGSTWFGLDLGGKLYWVHREDHANSLTTVYMSNPNLPLRFRIANSGTGGVASLLHICGTVISEGGAEHSGIARSIYRTTALTTLNNTSWYPLIAFRLQAGDHQNCHIHTQKLSILCTTNCAFVWRLVLNPTVVGTALSFTPVTNSGLEADVSRTNATTITGGTDLDAGMLQQTAESSMVDLQPSALRMGASIAGVSDIVVLAVSRLTGTTEDFFASIGYLEQN